MNRTKAMENLELILKADLNKMISDNQIDSDKSIDYLINRLAITRLLKHFDNVYSAIFGSQIELIYKLKSGDLLKKNAKIFFDGAKEQEPDFYKNYSFNQWIKYLVNMSLIEEKDGNLILMPIGNDFLQYILDNALSLEKRG